MNSLVEFFQTHGVFAVSGIVAILWYLFLLESKSRSPLRLVVFPVGHLREMLDPRGYPTAIPITLSYLIFVGGIASLISGQDARVCLAGWCLLLLYELGAIAAYFLRPMNRKILLLLSVLILLAVSYGAFKTVQLKNFQIMNAIDFAAQTILFLGSVAALSIIIIKDRFVHEISSFFVFFGLIIYSFLQSLSTIMLTFDFFQNFDFAYSATLITLLFWLVSIPWIKRLKSRLT